MNEHLYRIIDETGVCCYLALGSDKAALLDTGNGIGDLREYVAGLTDLPVMVILTHGHLDHIGGAGSFEEVWMSHHDLPVFKNHGDIDFRVANTNMMTGGNYSADDFVPLFDGEIKNIESEACFDLGGLTIKMVPVKGHTPGMMCPLLMETREIIFGDACGISVLIFDDYSSNISKYRQSLVNLKEYENDYDNIYRNHGTFVSKKPLLDNVIECCNLILSRKDDRFPVKFNGMDLWACHEIEGHGRKDGLEGNIFYLEEKAY